MRRAVPIWLAALSALLSFSRVQADVPPLIPVQGYLTDAAGQPIDGKHRLTFWLYDAESGGRSLFSEDYGDLDVDEGVFVVYLGNQSNVDLSAFEAASGVWLEVAVDGDEIISPRTLLATTPFAAFAQACGDAHAARTLDNGSGVVRVDSVVEAKSWVSDDGSARAKGELVFRGSFDVWDGATVDSTSLQLVGPNGVCLACTAKGAPPVLPKSVRRYRFAVRYSDSVDDCSGQDPGSFWRLTTDAGPSAVHLEWTLPHTWSGANLQRTVYTDYFDQAVIDLCTASWGATCRLYGRLHESCAGRTLRVRSIDLLVYDELK